MLKKIRMIVFKLLMVAWVFQLAAANAGPAYAEDAKCTGLVIWPHEKSDLAPDPSIQYGRFPNGLRYILMPNKEPRNRVSAHLVLQIGSLNETEEERGVAHFLEHMLFNGTSHFPPGEMVKYFQRIGMQFGPDANAHTSHDVTVYDVLLPMGDRTHLDEALLVLQDYAQGALLLPEEIDRERKVVLAEKRTRDSAEYRTFEASLNFEMPETLLPKRLPIGLETVITNMDQTRMQRFYDTWYRPDNMFIVMAGDFEPQLAAELIEARFGKMSARAPGTQPPDLGNLYHKGVKAFYHHEQELGKTTITIERLKKIMPEPDSFDFQKRLLIRHLADQIIQNRLGKLISKPETPFTSASISSGIQLREFFYAEIMAQCRPENWESTLAKLEQILREALQYGFTETETERVKKDMLAEMDKAVKGAATRNSQALAGEMIWNLNNDRVFQSPEQEMKLFAPVVRSVTPAQLHTAFLDTWDEDSRLVLVTGNAVIQPAPEEKILEVMQKSRQVAVQPPKVAEAVKFPYLPADKRSAEVKREELKDLGIIWVDFENGLRLNLKPTKFKENELVAVLRFGQGRFVEPEANPGLTILAETVVNESGTGALKKDELEEALAGKVTNVRFAVSDEGMQLNGRSVTEEAELLFQLFQTCLQDAGFREDAYQLVKERFRQKYDRMTHSIEGAMELSGKRFLAGGDSRFGLPAYEKIMETTLEQVRAWVNQERSGLDLELSIAGDFDPEKMIALTGRYLSGIAFQGRAEAKTNRPKPEFPAGRALTVMVPTEIPKGLVDVVYPTADFWDIHRTRRMVILGAVFSEIMRVKIREVLGASYSSYAYNDPSRAYKDYGLFHSVVQVAPEDAPMVAGEIKKIAEEIRQGISEDLFRRALDPVLTSLKDMLRTNTYWLNNVMLGMKKHPEQLEWSRTMLSDYSAITKEEIMKYAGQYLDNQKTATIIILPEKKKSNAMEKQ